MSRHLMCLVSTQQILDKGVFFASPAFEGPEKAQTEQIKLLTKHYKVFQLTCFISNV